MSVKVVVEPADEPVTLAEAKAYLKVEVSDDDALIGVLITAARKACEAHTQRSLAAKTYELALDEFPAEFELPYPPALAVVSLKYIDESGVEQTLDQSAYALDDASEPGWVLPAFGTDWPSTRAVANAVKLRYTAGAAVEEAKVAMLFMLAHWYENREAVMVKQSFEVPMSATFLLNQLRTFA